MCAYTGIRIALRVHRRSTINHEGVASGAIVVTDGHRYPPTPADAVCAHTVVHLLRRAAQHRRPPTRTDAHRRPPTPRVPTPAPTYSIVYVDAHSPAERAQTGARTLRRVCPHRLPNRSPRAPALAPTDTPRSPPTPTDAH